MITFFISWVKSIFGCIKNRHQHIILIAGADISTMVNQHRVSPFAFTLQKKWEAEKIRSKIVVRTGVVDDSYSYDFSIAPLLAFFAKLQVKQTTAWRLILSLLKPKTLVAIDWDIAINKACTAKKIKLYYLQHGVIVADHMYFGKHTLKNLPAGDLPYGFLSWDDVSARNFEDLCKTFVIGNQWNNAFLDQTFLHWFQEDEAALALYAFTKPVVLFTLTWGRHHQHLMPKCMTEAIKQTIDNFTWVIRLHPAVYMKKENRDDFQQFLNQHFTAKEIANIFWKEFNTLPLPLILTKTKVHITIESSVVIEAAQFGIPSLILNSNVVEYGPNGENTPPYGGPSYFKLERECGYAEVYNADLNIKDWISQQTKKKPLGNLGKNSMEWKKFTADNNTPFNMHKN